MKNHTLTALQANINNGLYASDTAYINKAVLKNASHFADLLPLLVTSEQLNACNQKAVKRLVQSINFALNGNVSDFDAVTAYMVSAVILTKQPSITFQNAHFLCGLNTEHAQAVQGASRARLNKFIGNAGTAGTITSKVSRTTGKGGFFTALNITNKSDKHGFTLSDNAKQNALLLSYAVQLEKMTDSTFLTLTNKNK